MKPELLLLVPLIILFPTHILLAHASSTPNSDHSDLCPEFFINLTLALSEGFNVSEQTYNMFLYSGHNLNDLGDYQVCTSLITQKYSLVNFITSSGEEFTVGLCGPSVCSVNQLQNYTDVILGVLYNLTTKYTDDLTVVFVDPDQTGIQTGFWLYFTLVLYGLLFLFVITGTWLKYHERVKKESQEDAFTSLEGPLGSVLGQHLLLNKDRANSIEGVQSPTEPVIANKAKTFFRKFLESFDTMENLESLFSIEEIAGHDQNLNCVNGIRTLAFGWVVYGHTFSLSKAAKNFAYIEILMKSPWALLAVAAFYAVDTFFFLSGFFAGFLLISKLKRMPLGVKNYLFLLFHRWIRLWPAYMVVILFFWKISVNLASGPLWYSYVENAQYCSDGAWKNALLMDNVLNTGFPNYCFGGGWYLACDFQMFLLAPFICWIYLKKKNWSLALLGILFVVSMVLSYIEAYNSGYTYILLPDNQMENSYMLNYYENTVVRMPPYLIGLWLGTMFKEYKAGQKNFFSWIQSSQLISAACTLLGLGLLCLIVFFPRTVQTGNIWANGFAISWSAFSRPMWAVGIFFTIAPCLVGNMQFMGNFLGNYYFTLVSRLSYTGYLIHLVFLQIVFDGTDQIYGLSEENQASIAFAVMLLSCGGAVIIYLFVEKPIINIEGLLMKRKKN